MPLLYIVGLHGCGKTTAGLCLKQGIEGHSHISIGNLARLVRKGRIPADVPIRLITTLSKHKPGTVFQFEAAELIASYLETAAMGGSSISVDGFPSSPEHIQLLPKNAVILHLCIDMQTRHNRLDERDLATGRKWVSGGVSERDEMLTPMLDSARQNGIRIIEFENSGSQQALQSFMLALHNDLHTTPKG